MKKQTHFLRFGTVGDKAHHSNAVGIFDNLVINANSAAHVSGAIAKFIIEKLYNRENKGYFIDPITYAFQKNIHKLKNEKGILKKSISKLIERYGIASIINDGNALGLSYFSKQVTHDFCEKVLNFQYGIIQEFVSSDGMSEYLLYDTKTTLDEIQQIHPKLLIAPYFYLDVNDDDFYKWLDINTGCIKISKSLGSSYKNLPVFAQITLNRACLTDKEKIRYIIHEYATCGCDGYTVWIDDFDEHSVSKEELTGFIEFLKGLKDQSENKQIYNMYGGYFSVLLMHREVNLLDAVSHGLEYGESREVYPVGGGLPTSKYYFPPLHIRFDFTKAFYLLDYRKIIDTSKENWGTSKNYFAEICDCRICKETLGNTMLDFTKFESDQHYDVHQKTGAILRRKKASKETKQICLYHYLLRKNTEYKSLNKNSLTELINELLDSYGKYIGCRDIDKNELSYIINWYEVLKVHLKG